MSQYFVVTKHSQYMIDEETQTLIRFPRELEAVNLRRDGEPIHMIELPQPKVGESMEVVLSVREDGVKTLRTTTEVLGIETVDGSI